MQPILLLTPCTSHRVTESLAVSHWIYLSLQRASLQAHALLLLASIELRAMQTVKEVSCMGKKLLLFFLHRKEWIQHVPGLPLFFSLTTCSPLFIKWHPESSASHLLWLKYFSLTNTKCIMPNKKFLKGGLLWKQSLLFPTQIRC